MQPDLEIIPYQDQYKTHNLATWEQSVRAHPPFFKSIGFCGDQRFPGSMDFNDLQVFCMVRENHVLGFIGVLNRKIEMLFMDPKFFGRGLGQKLLHIAINELGADSLDVNEQNAKALQFYQKSGFEIIERTDKDDQGRNYPLLRMKLKDSK